LASLTAQRSDNPLKGDAASTLEPALEVRDAFVTAEALGALQRNLLAYEESSTAQSSWRTRVMRSDVESRRRGSEPRRSPAGYTP
jgi:hypothetical protein